MSGVTPQSTTAQMAGNVPKEVERNARPEPESSDLPGTFPETPFHEAQEFSVAPIPATSGTGNTVKLAPGDKVPHPNTLTSNTISSTVRDDPSLKGAENSEQAFGVAPLPATSGIGNPISLKPGEKVPHPSTFTQNTVHSNVTTDKASYENSSGVPHQSLNTDIERDTKGGMFSVPAVSKGMIPESSLPMGGNKASEPDPGVTIQSAGPQSTTAALAANVPLEPRGVPEVVSESQHEAGVGPEASGNREAVKEKTAMEKELESRVPEEPATSEGSNAKTGGIVAGGLAVGGAVAAGAAAYVAKSSSVLPASVQQSIDEMNKGTAIAPTVPDVVQKSITQSHQSPEAAGSKTMVGEKSAMENELLKDVKREENIGKPAPSSSAALTEAAPSATAPKTPAKDAVPVTTVAAPAQTPVSGNAMKQAIKQSKPESRDISPMSHPTTVGQTKPIVTTGVGSSTAPQTSQATSKPAAAATPSPAAKSSASTDKKSKRSSGFFGKLKSKFSDKDKKGTP